MAVELSVYSKEGRGGGGAEKGTKIHIPPLPRVEICLQARGKRKVGGI